MALDQQQDPNPLPAGWAFGKNSIKAHYFKAGHFTSLCGACVSNNGRQRNDRTPTVGDCKSCREDWYSEEKEKAARDG